MRWLLSFLALAIVAVVKAASFTGNRLLVVLEEQAEREKYSVFLEDLTGKCIFLLLEQLENCVHRLETPAIFQNLHLELWRSGNFKS